MSEKRFGLMLIRLLRVWAVAIRGASVLGLLGDPQAQKLLLVFMKQCLDIILEEVRGGNGLPPSDDTLSTIPVSWEGLT